MSSEATHIAPKTQSQDHWIEVISPWVTPLGFRIIYLELLAHRQKVLRIYIDHLEPLDTPISIDDCVRVARALDEPLDHLQELDAAFAFGGYELEVSSPGINRPLRTAFDFNRFSGREARIHVFRPLSGEEIENLDYQQKNPKQKNFLGILDGLRNDKIVLRVGSENLSSTQKSRKKNKASHMAALKTNSEEGIIRNDNDQFRITIPLPLISKANLEPKIDFEESDERE